MSTAKNEIDQFRRIAINFDTVRPTSYIYVISAFTNGSLVTFKYKKCTKQTTSSGIFILRRLNDAKREIIIILFAFTDSINQRSSKNKTLRAF